MEEDFCGTASDGKVEEMKEILRDNPTLDVNWTKDEDGCSALYLTCSNGHDSAVSVLLAHPDIDVNLKNMDGDTPFGNACYHGNTSCVQEMLKDSRVNVNEVNQYGCTPLYWAAYFGHVDIIRWWIVSGREMDLGTPEREETDAVGAAKQEGRTDVVTLLERFKSDPTKTRSEVKMELGITTGQYSCHPSSIIRNPSLGGDLHYLFVLFAQFRFPCDHPTQAHAARVPGLS